MKPRSPVRAACAGFVALAAIVIGRAATAQDSFPPNIEAAVDNPARPADDRAKDAARKPGQVLEFAHVREGQTVVDFMPGNGYWTRMFSKAVGPNGHVYAFIPTEVASHVKGGLPANGTVDPKMPNVTYLVAPVMQFSAPIQVDLFWTGQNYHDLHDPFMGPANMEKFNASVYESLTTGGRYVIEDHAAKSGSGVSATNTLHRIDPAEVKREVMGAGFIFNGELKVLRNPADDHTLLVFDPKIRGHTDQFVYKFVKE